MRGQSSEQRIKHALEMLTRFQRYVILLRLIFWLADYYIKNSLLLLSQLIITPSGIHLDRRHANQFHFPERRTTELARSIFRMLITGVDDTDPTAS